MKIMVNTNEQLMSVAILALRLMSGLILFVAGASKAAGWFGGMGMDVTVQMFQSNMHISAPWAYISTYTEFIGGLLLMIGLFTRVAAFLLMINMIVATVLVGTANFFMGGAAYPCLLAVTSLVILLTGPMKISIDYLLQHRKSFSIQPAL